MAETSNKLSTAFVTSADDIAGFGFHQHVALDNGNLLFCPSLIQISMYDTTSAADSVSLSKAA